MCVGDFLFNLTIPVYSNLEKPVDGEYWTILGLDYQGKLCAIIPLSAYTVKNYTVSCTKFNVVGTGDQTVISIDMKTNGCYIIIDVGNTNWIGRSVQILLKFTRK